MRPRIPILLCLAAAFAVRAQTPVDAAEKLVPLEELLQLKVRVVSRHDESAFEAPAALTVITREDIRSGGFTRLAELLRLVPGMHVVRRDANKWSINVRQAPARFASTMLVQLDGRTLYTTLHNGVYWEVQDYPLQDIERIEVIRGPGAALWGVNAVSGVINIVTRKAAATQGTLVSGRAGVGDVLAEGTLRHGGRIGEATHYRVFARARRSDRGEIPDADGLGAIAGVTPGDAAEDRGEMGQVGIRLEQRLDARQDLLLDLGLYRGQFHDYRVAGDTLATPNLLHARSAHALLRWTHRASAASETQLQIYHSWTDRADLSFEDSRNLSDLDLQHSQQMGRQRLTLGVGLRYVEDRTAKGEDGIFFLDPANDKQQILSAFVHDRIELSRARTFLILGSKFEHGEYTELDLQPSVRVLHTPSYRTTVWAGWTRSARTPSRTGLHGQLDFGGVVVPISDPDAESLECVSHELGLRRKFGRAIELDLAAFHDDYDEDVRSREDNGLMHVQGIECSYRQQYGDGVRWELSHVFHQATVRANGQESIEPTLPRHAVLFRVLTQLTPDLSAQLFAAWQARTYESHADDAPSIAEARRVDLVLRQRLRPGWELSLAGTNLLEATHREGFQEQRLATELHRAFWLRLTIER